MSIDLSRIPLMGGAIGASTVLYTLYRHVSQGFHPPIPTISMSAFRQPESFVFAAGLSSTAALLLITCWFMHLRLPRTRGIMLGRLALLSSVVSSVGMVITAVVPLQADIMDVLALPRAQRRMDLQSKIHQTSANVFFLSSLAHCAFNTLRIYHEPGAGLGRGGVSKLSFRAKMASLALSCMFIVSPLLLFMYPRIISGSRVTVVALNQYGAVLSLMAFYSTYALDLRGHTIDIKAAAENGSSKRD